MTNTDTDQALAERKPIKPEVPKPTMPVIRLDRSRTFSTVHGDRTPIDPFYRVHYMQGDLPFDANGIVIPDDGRTEPYTGVVEGQTILFQPLYTKERRVALERKIARILSSKQEAEEESANGPIEQPVDVAAEVNLESWLRGEVKYPFYQIAKACEQRFHKKHTSLRSVVEDLVLDEKIVSEDLVDKSLMRLLDSAR